ncbi:MAG: transposase [bacterium]|nr:transposase [bacterium]
MGYFTTIQMLLDIPTSLEVKEREEIDSFLLLLEESNVGEIITKNIKSNTSKGGRIGYNKYRMFAMILYGFSYYKVTLRELENACKFDIRFMYIMN